MKLFVKEIQIERSYNASKPTSVIANRNVFEEIRLPVSEPVLVVGIIPFIKFLSPEQANFQPSRDEFAPPLTVEPLGGSNPAQLDKLMGFFSLSFNNLNQLIIQDFPLFSNLKTHKQNLIKITQPYAVNGVIRVNYKKLSVPDHNLSLTFLYEKQQ